jgi:hypothetical protein
LLLFFLIGLAVATVWAWRSNQAPLGTGVDVFRQVPIDLVWLSFIPTLIAVFLVYTSGLSLNRLFVSFAIPVALFVVMYSFAYVPYHALHFNDSPTYLQMVLTGTYASNRNFGYPTILAVINATIGLDRIAWVQLFAVVSCYFTGAWLLGSHLRRRWLAPLLVGLFLAQGATSAFSDQLLTEALFTAGLGLFAASLGALVWEVETGAVAAGTIGIVLTILAKSIGIVLIVPALLTARFLPKPARLRVYVPILAGGLATYVAMAGYNFFSTGTFSPESFAGKTLVGHVAWMLDDKYLPRSDLTEKMMTATEEVVRRRPEDLTRIDSRKAFDRYVYYTAVEYDELFWKVLYPIGASQFKTGEEENEFYLRLAISSIRAHPVPYLLHSAAHFGGLWKDLGDIQSLREAAIDIRTQPLHETIAERRLRDMNPTSILPRYPAQAQLEAELERQKSLPLALFRLWDQRWINSTFGIALGVLALFLSVLFFIPSVLALAYRAEIMMALCLNAYFFAHALMHPTQARYANVGILAAFFLVATFIMTSIGGLRKLFGRDGEKSGAQ